MAENQRVPVCRGMKGTASGLAGMWSEDMGLNCLLACSCVSLHVCGKRGKIGKKKKTKLRVINRRGEAERGTGGEGGDREEE